MGSELIDRVASGAPVGEFLVIEAVGHLPMPFARYRMDDRALGDCSAASFEAMRSAVMSCTPGSSSGGAARH